MATRIFQNNFTSGVFAPSMYSRTDLAKYRSGCKRIVNGIVHIHGGVSKRPGTYFVDRIPGNARPVKFSYSRSDKYLLLFLSGRVRFYLNGSIVAKEGNAYEITSPYSLDDVMEMSFVQSGDVIFIAHPNHPPRTLTRYDLTDWSFAEMRFNPDIQVPAKPTLTRTGFSEGNGLELKYKISASTEEEEESYPSEEAAVFVPKQWTSGATVTITWGEVAKAKKYNIYKNIRGFYGWIGSVDATSSRSFKDDNIEPASNDGPKESKEIFNGEGNYPAVVAIFQQRLIFGRTDKQRLTVWASQPGNFFNFSSSRPLKDDDGIEVTMDSREMDEIRHLILNKRIMLVFSEGGEWTMTPGENSDAITPTTTKFNNQSFFGCSTVQPITAGGSIIQLQNSGKLVRDLFGSSGEYSGTEISILANHFFAYPVTAWDYQDEPWHILYAVRSDGALLTLSYLREQEVYAWSEHHTDGEYKNVAVLRNGGRDDAYFSVKRGDGYFVEYQKIFQESDAQETAFFVDCGLSRNGEAVTEVSGLEHLAGLTVTGLADGCVIAPREVSADGKITLDVAASQIQVGLPYTFLLETLDPEINAGDGSTMGLRKNVAKITVRLERSGFFKVGPTEKKLTDAKLYPGQQWGKAPPLFSGDLTMPIEGEYRTDATVVFKQEPPLPITVLALVKYINSEGDR